MNERKLSSEADERPSIVVPSNFDPFGGPTANHTLR